MTLKVVTHNGAFHSDELMALAVIVEYYGEENLEIIRSCNKEDIHYADIVVDVGEVYNPKKLRFDHHQRGFRKRRRNGAYYASAGLVWHHFGPLIVSQRGYSDGYLQDIVRFVDSKLMVPIDVIDTGQQECAPRTLNFSQMVGQFNNDKNFDGALEFCRTWLNIILDSGVIAAESRLIVDRGEYIEVAGNPKAVLVLDKLATWQSYVTPETVYVVFPDSVNGWRACCNRQRKEMHFPKRWRGLSGDRINGALKTEDAIFCHDAGFILGAVSKETTIELAVQAYKQLIKDKETENV